MTCPRCGQELPERARFCARCGARLAAGARGGAGRVPPTWLIVLFWVGSLVPLVLVLVYLVTWIAPDPGLARAAGSTPDQLQSTAAIVTVYFGLVLLLQCAGAWALTYGREWGRVLASLVCALWMVTCVGIPLAILGLVGIWRPWPAAPPPPPPAPRAA
jgi:hypothetical protein